MLHPSLCEQFKNLKVFSCCWNTDLAPPLPSLNAPYSSSLFKILTFFIAFPWSKRQPQHLSHAPVYATEHFGYIVFSYEYKGKRLGAVLTLYAAWCWNSKTLHSLQTVQWNMAAKQSATIHCLQTLPAGWINCTCF